MNENRTIWRWLADWLAVRHPTRLVVDGVFLMFWAGVVYLVWTIWWEMNDVALRTSPTRLDRSLSLLFISLRVAPFDLGVVLVAVGCARIIADGVRGRGVPATDAEQVPPSAAS